MKTVICLFAGMLLTSPAVQAQEKAQEPKKGDGSERNVMLNASDANKPREIQIGLPSEDVNVYENGMPAVYSSSLHNVATHWRSDVSLSYIGMLNPSESAVMTGNVAYSVNSFSQIGSQNFKGKFHYLANHYGQQQFDLNVSGAMGKGFMYSGSVYQNFDPGAFKLRFSDYQDRTQIYKAALTKTFGDNKGRISLLYHHSQSVPLANAAGECAFIYVGDGSVKEIPGIALGTTSYLPENGEIAYRKIKDGSMVTGKYSDFSKTRANQVSLLTEYLFENGINLTFNGKYMYADAAYYAVGGNRISDVLQGTEQHADASVSGMTYYDQGELYTGKKQGRIGYSHEGDVTNLLFTSEIKKTSGNHSWRIGFNQWRYQVNYSSETTQFDQTVNAYPRILTRVYTDAQGNTISDRFYGYNSGGAEFYTGYENKLAAYFTDEWQPNDKWYLYYGARGEYYKVKGKNLPYARFDNFHIGATNGTETVALKDFGGDYFNYAFMAQARYHILKGLGANADITYATKRPAIADYAGYENPSDKMVSIPLVRAGLFYRNSWLDITSMFTYIQKTNNYKRLNISNPKPGSTEIQAAAFNYDIQTLGWTTNMELNPFKGFHLHFLFTYQRPTYKKYESTVHFDDGSTGKINATGKIVTEIPQILLEIDPSYEFSEKLRLWASFRYFGKTYANLTNALYFNSRWETFAGINYQVNKTLSLSGTVINFLNQTGASGSIAGSELIKPEEASQYDNHWMYGKYLRPFTVELSAVINF